jgi:hypothetical protein
MQELYIQITTTDLQYLTCNSPQWTVLPTEARTQAQVKGTLYENAQI